MQESREEWGLCYGSRIVSSRRNTVNGKHNALKLRKSNHYAASYYHILYFTICKIISGMSDNFHLCQRHRNLQNLSCIMLKLITCPHVSVGAILVTLRRAICKAARRGVFRCTMRVTRCSAPACTVLVLN